MKKKELLRTLEALHQELAGVSPTDGDIDAETRALLATLTEDMRRLARPDGAQVDGALADGAIRTGGDSTLDVSKLSEQVHDLMLKFESQHPQLTRALNQVSTALANLGI